MSHRIDRSWIVFESLENDQHNRCVDLFQRTDGTWGFEEFRRDPEDTGAWTRLGSYAVGIYASRDAALATAQARIAWMVATSSTRLVR